MKKGKPATLSSSLLARKGEAEPARLGDGTVPKDVTALHEEIVARLSADDEDETAGASQPVQDPRASGPVARDGSVEGPSLDAQEGAQEQGFDFEDAIEGEDDDMPENSRRSSDPHSDLTSTGGAPQPHITLTDWAAREPRFDGPLRPSAPRLAPTVEAEGGPTVPAHKTTAPMAIVPAHAPAAPATASAADDMRPSTHLLDADVDDDDPGTRLDAAALARDRLMREQPSGRGSGRFVLVAIGAAVLLGAGIGLWVALNRDVTAEQAGSASAPALDGVTLGSGGSVEVGALPPAAPRPSVGLEAVTPAAPAVPAPDAASASAPVAGPAAAPAAAAPTPAESSPAVGAPVSAESATPPAAGGYTVQLLSTPSEQAAGEAWTRLSAKFGKALGGLSHDVVRADLGAKGVFYRLQAGGFATQAEAKVVCDALKAGKQSCLVVKR